MGETCVEADEERSRGGEAKRWNPGSTSIPPPPEMMTTR